MRIRSSVSAVVSVVVALALPAFANAQPTRAQDSASSFLVSGLAQGQSQGSSCGGVGFGIKGGWLYSSFDQAGKNFGNDQGWEAGFFFGGNRSGVIGATTELMYAKKVLDRGVTPID